jgi:hypothetical protein
MDCRQALAGSYSKDLLRTGQDRISTIRGQIIFSLYTCNSVIGHIQYQPPKKEKIF